MKRVVLTIILLASSALFAQPAPFKNVQVLKELTPAQLDGAMDLIRASLGARCDTCHVRKEREWDFPSDEKPEKKRAREMMQLVIDTNAKYFNNRTIVTCNTCHRGSQNPVGMLSLPQAQLPPPSKEEKRPPLPARDEVVAKYAAAVGKVDSSALSSMTMKGSREAANGNKTEIEVIQHNGSMRAASSEFANVLTPSGGWFWSKERGAKEMSPEQLELTVQVSNALRFITPDDVPADARVVRKDKIDDRDVYVLQSSVGPKVRQRLYFDAENGLLVRRLLLTASPIGEIPLQTNFSDYRDAGGFKLPFTIRLDRIDPDDRLIRHYTEIHTNAKVDESVFVMPKS